MLDNLESFPWCHVMAMDVTGHFPDGTLDDLTNIYQYRVQVPVARLIQTWWRQRRSDMVLVKPAGRVCDG
jgi:hypothetical protein